MQSKETKKSLLTKWAKDVQAGKQAWHEYPRPQLVRDKWQNLNGSWLYCITESENEAPLASFRHDGEITVPFSLESTLSGVTRSLKPSERLWYKTVFKLELLDDIVYLHFGAVDWHTEVWVNGIRIGEHKGGYCPFSFNVASALRDGENELIVAVKDDTDEGLQERGKQSLKPKGLFYTAVSGIWQTVWLEAVPNQSVKSLHFQTDITKESVAITGLLNSLSDLTVHISIYDGQDCIANELLDVKGDKFNTSIKLNHIKLWHPDQPHLYDVIVTVHTRDNKKVDEVKTYFAMREIKAIKDPNGSYITLNGSPIFQLGILDQGYWPDGLYTAPSDEALIEDIIQMKKLGFNMIRKHIKVEQARFYYHCDRLGMLVWQDMVNGGEAWNVVQEALLPNLFPNWFRKDHTRYSYKRTGRLEKENREQFMAELTDMIKALRHFPSIVVWCPFNEGWGQFDASRMTDYILSLDSTRLVDHASGWFDQGAGHMRSVHTYFRPLSKPKRLLGRVPALTEFGGYNLKIEGHTELGHKEVGYKKCHSGAQLQQKYMKLMDQLSKQIEHGLAASIYTQLSDVEGEVNGILTYDREVVKLDEQQTITKHQELMHTFKKKWSNNSIKQ